MSFEIGQQVGAYRIERQLGKGGMATVYLARHQSLDRDVAIKMLHVAYKDDDTFIERFRREAQIVGRLEHPNIVPIYDFADAGLHPYLVMKYIEGETLKQYLRRSKEVGLTEVMRIMTAVASALDYAHQRGILHRDVKPSNIMVSSDGTPYLTDFGLARIASLGESTLSRDMMLGTPQYISPEQAQGNRELDARTDIYSLGIVLYELVVGRVPFTGDTPYAIIHNHIFTPLPPPREMNPTVTPEVEQVLMRALAKDPNDRYASAGEMIGSFKAAIEHENVTELSASSVRPEAFADHAAKSMQQPMIQSPMAGMNMPVTPTPTPMGGMWMTNTKRQTKRQSFFGANIWAVSGCGIFICSCMMMFAVFANASATADSLAVEPIFSARPTLERPTDDFRDGPPPDGDNPRQTITPETDTSNETAVPSTDGNDTDREPTNTPYPTRDTSSVSQYESLADILDSDLTIETAEAYVDANPEDPLGYFALGILYMDNEEMTSAVNVFNEAMRQRNPSPELMLEMIDYLAEHDRNEATVRLIVSAMNLHPDEPLIRERGREYMYTYVDGLDPTTSLEIASDLNMLCAIGGNADNPRYLQSLIGLYFINNAQRLAELRWARTCSDDIQAPIEELIHLDDGDDLLPEMQLIQAKYYYRTEDLNAAQNIIDILLADENTPEWLYSHILEVQASVNDAQ